MVSSLKYLGDAFVHEVLCQREHELSWLQTQNWTDGQIFLHFHVYDISFNIVYFIIWDQRES